MTTDTCSDCVYFKPFEWPSTKRPAPDSWLEEHEGRGVCRRFPPQTIVRPLLKEDVKREGIMADLEEHYPRVGVEDWCGEHSLDHTKAAEAKRTA